MSWEGPDPTRDEDRYYEDAAMVPAALLGPEIGSESWVRDEIAAGRSGDEHDRSTLSAGSHRGASPRSTPRLSGSLT